MEMEKKSIITKASIVKPNTTENSSTVEKMVMVIIFMEKVNILVHFKMDLCMISKVKYKPKTCKLKMKESIIRDPFIRDIKMARE